MDPLQRVLTAMPTTTCQRCGQSIQWRPEAQDYVAEIETEHGTYWKDCEGQAHLPPVGRHKADG